MYACVLGTQPLCGRRNDACDTLVGERLLSAGKLFAEAGAMACMRASSVFSRSAGGATMLVKGSLVDVYFQRVNWLQRRAQ